MSQDELIDFIKVYGRDIYSFCLSLTGNKTDADDLYQDSFFSLFRKLSTVAEVTNPKSYMLAVVVRRWKDKKRKYARRQRLAPMYSLDELEDTGGSGLAGQTSDSNSLTGYAGYFGSAANDQPEKNLLDQEMRQEICNAVSKLAPKMKLPIYLYYMEDLPIAEISRILHLPQGTVKSRLHKARIILRERMVERGYEI